MSGPVDSEIEVGEPETDLDDSDFGTSSELDSAPSEAIENLGQADDLPTDDVPPEDPSSETEAEEADSPQASVAGTVQSPTNSTIEFNGFKYEASLGLIASADEISSHLRRDLAIDDSAPLSREQLRDIDLELPVIHQQRDLIQRCIERHRLVLVVGERGLGKSALSQVVAGKIAAEDPEVEELRICSALERHVRFRPEVLFGGPGGFERRIVLLEDAFEAGNRDLRRVVKRLDSPQLGALKDRLESAGSYLILTSSRDRLPREPERLAELGAAALLVAPEKQDLVQLLHRRAGQRADDRKWPGAAHREKIGQLLSERGDELAVRLRTAPRAVDFVDSQLSKVVQGEIELDKALDQMDKDSLEDWLLVELPNNRPQWCFVLALALATADPLERWVSWPLQQRLWRKVESLIEKTLGPLDEHGRRPLDRLVVDRSFLESARAKVQRLPYPIGEVVGFEDPSMAQHLWRIFVGSGRSFAMEAQAWAEGGLEQLDSPDRLLRARILGRLGELDPRNALTWHMDAWLNLEDDDVVLDRAVLLGEMLLGASGSEDSDYFDACLERLEGLMGTERAEAAMVALVALRSTDGQRVVEILSRVLDKHVVKPSSKRGSIAHRVQPKVDALMQAKERVKGRHGRDLSIGEAEVIALEAIGPPAQRALAGASFVLVGLGFGMNPLFALEAISGWLQSDEPELGGWIAFCCLSQGGVLDRLESYGIKVRVESEPADSSARSVRCSRLLFAAEEDAEIGELAEFVELLHRECARFPHPIRGNLRRRLLRAVQSWLKQASRAQDLRQRTINLVVRLLDSPNSGLRKGIFELVRRKRSDKEPSSKELALEILRSGAPG